MIRTIAIVDDEAEMEFLYELMLEEFVARELVELKYFSDAREFLHWIAENSPHLILSDISMPYVSGFELGRRIRGLLCSAPIYFVSGHEEMEYQDSLREITDCRYLSKPLNTEHFLHLIKTDLGLN